MLKQLNLTDLIAGIKHRIESGTDVPFYDIPPADAPAPFVFAEITQTENADTKTQYCKIYRVWLHVIAEENGSSIPLYAHIQHVQEALTQDIKLPRGLNLITQTDEGIQTIKTDETSEKHAILQYAFKIGYGFKIKNNYGFRIYQ